MNYRIKFPFIDIYYQKTWKYIHTVERFKNALLQKNLKVNGNILELKAVTWKNIKNGKGPNLTLLSPRLTKNLYNKKNKNNKKNDDNNNIDDDSNNNKMSI